MTANFRLVCPHCKRPTRASAEAFYRWWPDEVAEFPLAENNGCEAAAASYCPECEEPLVLIIEGKQKLLRDIMSGDMKPEDQAFHQTDLTLKRHIPAGGASEFTEAVPLPIRIVFKEMQEDVARKRNSAGVLTSCRGIVEVALATLESGSLPSGKKSLINRIDHLRSAGLLTEDLAEWAHQIRLDGNKSAHELIGDPDLAREYVNFLGLFIEVAFELPERIKKIKERSAEVEATPRPGAPAAS